MSSPDTTAGPAAALYLYAVCPADEPLPAGLTGLGDSPVLRVQAGPFAAVVGRAPTGRLRPERRHLAAHQAVVQRLAQQVTTLPMAFGTVLPNAEALQALLDEHTAAIAEQIERVRGRVEMIARVAIDPDALTRELVEGSPELRSVRARIAAGAASHAEKVEAGRLYERLLEDRRAACLEKLLAELRPCSAELLPLPPKGAGELAGVAGLIARDQAEAFEQGVGRVAATLDDRHTVKLSGPWPAHSFVDLRLSVPEADARRAA